MFLNMSSLQLSIVSVIDSIRDLLGSPSQVQVDPSKPLAGCRLELDPKEKNPVKAQCRIFDREQFEAAQAQGLQCRMEPKITLERGKATVDFMVYCGPKTVAQEVRRAKVYFGEQLHMRTFKELPRKRLEMFLKKIDPQTLERLKNLNPHHRLMPPRAHPNIESWHRYDSYLRRYDR